LYNCIALEIVINTIMKKYCIVYMTVNLITTDFYIGKHETNNLNDSYLGSGKRLKNSVRKYGAENFERHILSMWSSPEEALMEETKVVAQYLDHPKCLNIVDGGRGFSSRSAKRASDRAIAMGRHGSKFLTKEHYAKAGAASARVNKANGTGMWGLTTDERRYTSSKANKNTIWINDGTNQVKIKSDEEIPVGFVKGRLTEGSKYRKGMQCWTDGVKNVFSNECPGNEFRRGMTKDTPIPEFNWWNNGKVNVRSLTQPDGFVSGMLKWTSKQVTCPHCGKEGGEPAMKRHHFDNCKRKKPT
jgi:hypothetical protein